MTNKSLPLAALLGAGIEVPVWGGVSSSYINLDNAATAPPFQSVWDTLAKVMPYYGSIHRGAGFKSIISTSLYESAINDIIKYSDANTADDVVIFSHNTTACINHLERRLQLTSESIVINSEFEHSSNLLPWKKNARTIECHTNDDGSIDLQHLEQLLKEHKVTIVAVTAASNVTGRINDVHKIAMLAHRHGAKIFVDASQFVAHRKLVRKPKSSDEHLDYVAYCGHKMYAPFGLGVLIANKQIFESGWPDVSGGGTIQLIDGKDIIWSELPSRESGGTPNFAGIIAVAAAFRELYSIGFDRIREHESLLTSEFSKKIASLKGVTVHRTLNDPDGQYLAIFPFTVSNRHHSMVGAFLGTEHAIGVRTGHLCQFSLIRRLLGIEPTQHDKIKSLVRLRNKKEMYGIVRSSCGVGNTPEDIDRLGTALECLLQNQIKTTYTQNEEGEFIAEERFFENVRKMFFL